MALTAKGTARREMILDSVPRVLELHGPSGVTHRSVATEAEVPLAAMTYYFANLDELYVEALRRATAGQAARMSQLGRHDIPTLARIVHGWIHSNRAAVIAQYELMFLAMRRESLRAEAALWYHALEAAIDPEHRHPARTRVAALALDGLVLRMLWEGEPSTVQGTTQALIEILGARLPT